VVDVLQIGAYLAAQPAVGDGVVGVAAKADGAAVHYLDERTTGVRAVVGAGAADESGVRGSNGRVGQQRWVGQESDLTGGRAGRSRRVTNGDYDGK